MPVRVGRTNAVRLKPLGVSALPRRTTPDGGGYRPRTERFAERRWRPGDARGSEGSTRGAVSVLGHWCRYRPSPTNLAARGSRDKRQPQGWNAYGVSSARGAARSTGCQGGASRPTAPAGR